MKIALTYHTSFARVRRGTERLMDETAAFLAGRGHEPTVIACKPGRTTVNRDRGFETVHHRRLWHPLLAHAGIHEYHAFPLQVFGHLLTGRFDVVHTFSFFDAYAAILARRITRVPVILVVNNLPVRVPRVRTLSLGGAICRRAVRGADAVVAFSEFMQQYIADRWQTPSVIIPPPVDLDQFPLHTDRVHDPPVILCAATLDDPRKGGPVLMRAFNRLKESRADAVLRISSATPEHHRSQLVALVEPRWRPDVEFTGPGRREDLHRVFGAATVSVLPSRREPFGLVVVESLATGTPVVGTREGALIELLGDPRVGRLFDPGDPHAYEATNDADLSRALLEALDLGRREETARHCRAQAERFSWPVIGPRVEALCERVVSQARKS